MSGAGTGSNAANTASVTAPWSPAQSTLQTQLGNAAGLSAYGAPSSTVNNLGQQAYNAATSLSPVNGGTDNPGASAASLGQNFMTGDPQGTLASGLQNYQSTVSPIANMSANPMNNPATQQLMQAIQDQTQQSINGQFAGAGRSMSGYNTKDLAMGLSEGEAPTLFNQYNQNLANIQGASSGLLNAGQTTQGLENANQQAGLQLASSAYPLSQLPEQTQIAANNMAPINQAQLAGLGENLTIPIAGLGGQTQGQVAGTQTASPLTQLGQLGGLFGTLV